MALELDDMLLWTFQDEIVRREFTIITRGKIRSFKEGKVFIYFRLILITDCFKEVRKQNKCQNFLKYIKYSVLTSNDSIS